MLSVLSRAWLTWHLIIINISKLHSMGGGRGQLKPGGLPRLQITLHRQQERNKWASVRKCELTVIDTICMWEQKQFTHMCGLVKASLSALLSRLQSSSRPFIQVTVSVWIHRNWFHGEMLWFGSGKNNMNSTIAYFAANCWVCIKVETLKVKWSLLGKMTESKLIIKICVSCLLICAFIWNNKQEC